jgi:hypothetical protein
MAEGLENQLREPLSALGHEIDCSAARFGFMQPSNDLLNDRDALLQRLDSDGYLYIQNILPREAVAAARESILGKLQADDVHLFDESRPLPEGALSRAKLDMFRLDDKPTFRSAQGDRRDPDTKGAFRPDLASRDPAIQRIVFGHEIASFYAFLFGEPVSHFDYIWLRLMGPGRGTPTHCDNVYMSRGSADLLTCWIPYGDIPLDIGGLMVLEGSNSLAHKLDSYLSKDVDSYCINDPEERQRVAVNGEWSHRGWLTDRPDLLPERFGGRWVTAREWKMGDFVTFKMTTIHGSLDNRSDRLRISTDTRWQPSAHPIDDRWIGENPPGHSLAGKRGRIC